MIKSYEKEIEYQKVDFFLKKQKQEIENSVLSQEKEKELRHDFKNTVILISNYIEQGYLDEAKNNIKNVQMEMDLINDKMIKVYTTNKDLNYLLIHKSKVAKYHGIDFSVECMMPEELIIPNKVIINLVGNLLDNSINACKEIENRHLALKVKYLDNNLIIDIKNTVTSDFNIKNLVEGTGISSIRRIVKQNNGIFKYYLKKGKFCVQIILWNFKGDDVKC